MKSAAGRPGGRPAPPRRRARCPPGSGCWPASRTGQCTQRPLRLSSRGHRRSPYHHRMHPGVVVIGAAETDRLGIITRCLPRAAPCRGRSQRHRGRRDQRATISTGWPASVRDRPVWPTISGSRRPGSTARSSGVARSSSTCITPPRLSRPAWRRSWSSAMPCPRGGPASSPGYLDLANLQQQFEQVHGSRSARDEVPPRPAPVHEDLRAHSRAAGLGGGGSAEVVFPGAPSHDARPDHGRRRVRLADDLLPLAPPRVLPETNGGGAIIVTSEEHAATLPVRKPLVHLLGAR